MKEQMMILADGSIVEYNEIKRLSIEDYLVKLESYCKRIEQAQKK